MRPTSPGVTQTRVQCTVHIHRCACTRICGQGTLPLVSVEGSSRMIKMERSVDLVRLAHARFCPFTSSHHASLHHLRLFSSMPRLSRDPSSIHTLWCPRLRSSVTSFQFRPSVPSLRDCSVRLSITLFSSTRSSCTSYPSPPFLPPLIATPAALHAHTAAGNARPTSFMSLARPLRSCRLILIVHIPCSAHRRRFPILTVFPLVGFLFNTALSTRLPPILSHIYPPRPRIPCAIFSLNYTIITCRALAHTHHPTSYLFFPSPSSLLQCFVLTSSRQKIERCTVCNRASGGSSATSTCLSCRAVAVSCLAAD
jgi:hypothetical protein